MLPSLGRWAAAAAAVGSMVLAAPVGAQVLPLPPVQPTPTPTPGPGAPEATIAPADAPPVAAPQPGGSAVVLGQDAAGSGASGDPSLAAPLGVAWQAPVTGVQQVVTGGGRVYVSHGGTVDAYDAVSGARAWSISGHRGLMAYGEGRLAIGAGYAGGLEVLDAATGAGVWRTDAELGGPLIDRDLVLARTNSRVVALRLADGGRVWEHGFDGTDGTVGVAGDRVYVDGPCTIGALDRRTGARIWSEDEGCSGGGGGRPLLWRDRVYATSSRLGARAAFDGAALPGPVPTAVTGDVGLLPGGDPTGTTPAFTAVRMPDGATLWVARRTSAVLGLPGAVLTLGSAGTLALRDAGTGAVRWSGRLRDLVGGLLGNDPLQLVAGEGRVLVTTPKGLVALAPVAAAPPLRATVTRAAIGVSGVPLRVRWRVEGPLTPTLGVEAKDGDAWTPIGAAKAGTAGHVSITVSSRRNGAIRLVGPGLAAPVVVPVRVFAPLSTRITQSRGGVVSVHVRLGRVPGLRPRGRRVAYYLRRGGSRTYRRLGRGRLGRDGRGTVRFRGAAARRTGRRRRHLPRGRAPRPARAAGPADAPLRGAARHGPAVREVSRRASRSRPGRRVAPSRRG